MTQHLIKKMYYLSCTTEGFCRPSSDTNINLLNRQWVRRVDHRNTDTPLSTHGPRIVLFVTQRDIHCAPHAARTGDTHPKPDSTGRATGYSPDVRIEGKFNRMVFPSDRQSSVNSGTVLEPFIASVIYDSGVFGE